MFVPSAEANLYGYVDNCPLVYTDPTGEADPVMVCAVVVIGTVVVTTVWKCVTEGTNNLTTPSPEGAVLSERNEPKPKPR